jgi:hypothetical protein
MRLSRCLIALVGVAALPGFAMAQKVSSSPPPKIAGIAPPPTPAEPANPHGHRTPVFFGNVPVVVLSDGRVFANFGRGFERVVNPCGVPASFGAGLSPALAQPSVVQPSVAQPPVGVNQPLPYTPPVPSQPTASQQMLPQASQQALASGSTLVNTQMCWGNDRGRVLVGRP